MNGRKTKQLRKEYREMINYEVPPENSKRLWRYFKREYKRAGLNHR